MTNENWSLVMKSDIGPAPRRFVLAALADHADPAGFCFPSIKLLCGETQQSKSTVVRAIQSLEADDLIRKVGRKRENGSTTSNLYRLNLDLIEARKRAGRKAEVSELEAQWALLTREDVAAGQTGVSERHPSTTSEDADPVDNSPEGGVTETPPGVTETPGRFQRDTPGGVAEPLPEPLLEPALEPQAPKPPAGHAHGRASRGHGPGQGSAPASGPPGSRSADRCDHGRTSCRTCRTNPRAQVADDQAAAQREGERCAMCRRTPSGSWQRVDPATGHPLDVVAGVAHTRSCDHRTPYAEVLAAIRAAEDQADALRAAQRRRQASPPNTRSGTGRSHPVRGSQPRNAPVPVGRPT